MCPQMPSIGHCGEIADLVAKPQVSLPWWKLDQLYNIILGRTNLPENYPKMHIKKMHIKHVNPKGPWTEFWEIGDDRMHFPKNILSLHPHKWCSIIEWFPSDISVLVNRSNSYAIPCLARTCSGNRGSLKDRVAFSISSCLLDLSIFSTYLTTAFRQNRLQLQGERKCIFLRFQTSKKIHIHNFLQFSGYADMHFFLSKKKPKNFQPTKTFSSNN